MFNKNVSKQGVSFRGFSGEFCFGGKKILYGLTLCLLTGVAACSSSSSPNVAPSSSSAALGEAEGQQVSSSGKVGIFLPLSGRNGGLGHNMLNAAKLALADEKDMQLDIHDTNRDIGSSIAAAIKNGDHIIIGPLTTENTGKISPSVKMASIPVLALTSDIHQAQEGVWVMGITPEQQVLHLVRSAKSEGRRRFAAFLPDTAFGHALGDGLASACEQEGLAPPNIVYHSSTQPSVMESMKVFSDYSARQAQAEAASVGDNGKSQSSTGDVVKDEKNMLSELASDNHSASSSESGKQGSSSPADKGQAGQKSSALAPPPFDALLLGDTGLQLQYVIDALKEAQVSPQKIRILGPGLWAAFSSKLGSLAGAWYASPDPASRQRFVSKYTARYHTSPKPLADLAYDAAALVGNLHKSGGGYTLANLTKPEGFLGVDGVFYLLQNGHVRRELGVFEIQPQGSAVIKSFPVAQPSTGKSSTPHPS